MIKLQVKAKFYNRNYTEFTVYLRFTDGIEPILITTNFNEVLEKIADVEQAIPQVTNYDVEFI